MRLQRTFQRITTKRQSFTNNKLIVFSRQNIRTNRVLSPRVKDQKVKYEINRNTNNKKHWIFSIKKRFLV